MRIFVRGVDNKSLGARPEKPNIFRRAIRRAAICAGAPSCERQFRAEILEKTLRRKYENSAAPPPRNPARGKGFPRAPKPAEYPQEPRNPLPTPRR
ncbi:MAG: hypothetical protein BHW65_06060 [Verrucomicrobia bacterium CAG:312_58_20]|nr:MAG: hypothetical protein BHW65_06060 [Verrucomicrobia bacterium CAG:312_58_20]